MLPLAKTPFEKEPVDLGLSAGNQRDPGRLCLAKRILHELSAYALIMMRGIDDKVSKFWIKELCQLVVLLACCLVLEKPYHSDQQSSSPPQAHQPQP